MRTFSTYRSTNIIMLSFYPAGNEQRFIFTFPLQSCMCRGCPGTRSIMEVQPSCLPPTVHLFERVPDTCSRGSGDRCHAISHCKHTHTETAFIQVAHYISNGPLMEPQQPTTMWWWWASFPALRWGEIFHTGSYWKSEVSEIALSCPFQVLVNKLQLSGAISDDLGECVLKGFHSCDFVFWALCRENKPLWSTIERNAPDLWPKRTSLIGGVS